MPEQPHPTWAANLIRAGRLTDGESVLVLVDEPLLEAGSRLSAAVADAGGRPTLALWAGQRPFSEPPPAAAESAATCDLCIFLAAAPRPDEAGARIALSEIVIGAGGRELFSGLVDEELLETELSKPPSDLAPAARHLLDQLEGRNEIHLRGTAGTDLRLRVEGRKWQTDALPIKAGEFANYPTGEVHISPLEDGADGLLVADLTVPYTVEGLVDEPVRIRFERGSAQSIEGGRAARVLEEIVGSAGESGRVIAELGIGLNHAVRPRGHVLLDEKAGGTAHVAIGNNTGSYGGVNESTIHVDCVLSEPTLEADGVPISLGVD